MVLKKQTVWLITMLSLLIVLSVYYLTAPDNSQVVGDQEDNEEQEEGTNEDGDSSDDTTTNGTTDLDVSGMTAADVFATIRLERDDTRNKMIEQWNQVLTSETATTEEKSEAMDQIHELTTIAQKETILERTIQAQKDYQDVLVQKNEDAVDITVISEELSKTDANHLMQMARDEFGIMDVRVSLQQDDV